MTKWHARKNDDTLGTVCDPANRRELVLVISPKDFRKRIASDRCGICEATMKARARHRRAMPTRSQKWNQ